MKKQNGFMSIESIVVYAILIVIVTIIALFIIQKEKSLSTKASEGVADAKENVVAMGDTSFDNIVLPPSTSTPPPTSPYESHFETNVKSNGTVAILKYIGPANNTNLIIPEYIGGKKVTEIADYAFIGPYAKDMILAEIASKPSPYINTTLLNQRGTNVQFTSIEFPETLTRIGDFALSGQFNISVLRFPLSITDFGSGNLFTLGNEMLEYTQVINPPVVQRDYLANTIYFLNPVDTLKINYAYPDGFNLFSMGIIDTIELKNPNINLNPPRDGASYFFTKTLILPDGLKLIPTNLTFQGINLEGSLKIYVPDSVTTIEDNAFGAAPVELIFTDNTKLSYVGNFEYSNVSVLGPSRLQTLFRDSGIVNFTPR